MSEIIEIPISVTLMKDLKKMAKQMGFVSTEAMIRELNRIMKEHPEELRKLVNK